MESVPGGYKSTDAFIQMMGGNNCDLYGHAGKFFVKLAFQGFSTKAEALATAGDFFQIYDSRIQ